MAKLKKSLQKGGANLAKTSCEFSKAAFYFFFETLQGVLKSFAKDLRKAKTPSEKFGVFFAIAIVLIITFSSIYSAYKWLDRNLINKGLYKQVFIENYEEEALQFFKLYERKFKSRDCDFMRHVAVDEAMYDKYGHTIYPKEKYNCENFYRGIAAKYFLPYAMEPVIHGNGKQRIRGKAIVTREASNGEVTVGAQYFEIWRRSEDAYWRFNPPAGGFLKIPTRVSES